MKYGYRSICILSLIAYLVLQSAVAMAQTFPEAVFAAMTELSLKKADNDMLMMTNIPYIKVAGKTALPFLEKAQEITGCTVGKGNLLFFQRPQSHPLRLMLFGKSSGDAVIISLSDGVLETEKLNISPDTILNASFWETAKENYKIGMDMFTLAAIANAWAKGAPYDFLKCTELHNHLCPGLTSGYLMAHFILKQYPLKNGERYTIVASPVWCKEDAFQVVLDCTPGKRGMVVKPLSKDQEKKISVADPAGFVLIWDSKKKTGMAAALSFDFTKFNALCPKDTPKAATILTTVEHLNTPEEFVSVSKEFELDEDTYNRMTRAGTNPYEVAGLLK